LELYNFPAWGCQDGWIVTLAEIRWLNVTTEVRMIVVEIGAWLLFEGKESEDLVERELFRIEVLFSTAEHWKESPCPGA